MPPLALGATTLSHLTPSLVGDMHDSSERHDRSAAIILQGESKLGSLQIQFKTQCTICQDEAVHVAPVVHRFHNI